MQKGSKFFKNSVMQRGPFVKVQIHVQSRSQSSTPLPSRGCLWFQTRGGAISGRGAGASDGGAKMTEKWCFRALFCQISSDEILKFPPTGG